MQAKDITDALGITRERIKYYKKEGVFVPENPVINGKTADWSDGEAWWRLTDKSGEATTVGAKDITLAADDAYTFTFTRGMDS